MNRIDVKQRGLVQAIAVAFLALGVGGGSLAMIASELARGRLSGALIGGVLLVVVVVVVGLFLRARARSALVYVSDAGIGLRNGKEVPWSQVRRLTDRYARTRSGHRVVWRSELEVDSHGPIWIIPQRVGNYPEVRAFLRSKPIAYAEA